MWDIVAIVVLVICCILGVVLTALRLPGTWLIVVAALAYCWWANWQRVFLVTTGVLIGIALVGEAIELSASIFTARRAGASRQAAWGGLIGGILGMLFLSFLVPIPFVGTMAGALVGCFGGAMAAELAVRKKLAQGTRVGAFSALGFVLGTASKMALAMVMSGVLFTVIVLS